MDIGLKKILTGFLFFIILFFAFFYFQEKNLLSQLKKIEKRQEEIVLQLKTNNPNNSNLKNNNNNLNNFQLLQEIGKLKNEVNQLKSQLEEQQDFFDFINHQSPTISPSPTLNNLKFVTIADKKWQQVDVYQEKSSSSKIIGQANYGKYYPYTKKENNYYYIQLENNLSGWINQQFVKEL